MKYWYEQGGEPMPEAGRLEVITDWNGNPTCIIEVTKVFECRFSEVDNDFAYAEGEGDRTLEWWRKAHWNYFSKECREAGIPMSEDVMLVLERFKTVYPAGERYAGGH